MLETNVTTGIHCWAARSVVGFVSCCASELEYVENLACATPCQALFLTMSTNGTFSTTLGEDGVTPMLRRWVNLLGSEVQRVSQSHYCTNCQRRMAVLPAYLQRRQWAEGEAGTIDEAHGCPLPQPSNWSIFPSGSFLDESWSNPFSNTFPKKSEWKIGYILSGHHISLHIFISRLHKLLQTYHGQNMPAFPPAPQAPLVPKHSEIKLNFFNCVNSEWNLNYGLLR